MKTPYALRTACTATGNVRFLERAALSPRHSCDDPLSRAAGNNGPDWSTLGADIVWCKCMPLRSAPRQLTGFNVVCLWFGTTLSAGYLSYLRIGEQF